MAWFPEAWLAVLLVVFEVWGLLLFVCFCFPVIALVGQGLLTQADLRLTL